MREQKLEITVFGCEEAEASMFCELAPRYGVRPVLFEEPVPPDGPVQSSRCISVSHKFPVSASVLARLHKAGARYICTRSIGQDHIDLAAARRLGMAVGGVCYSPHSVADYTLMLMLMAIRGAKSTVVRAEKNDFRLNAARGKELREMTVGVVGAGHIGQAVQQRLKGFGCRVLACSKRQRPGQLPLEDLLKQSDIVTLHTPLTKATHHLLGGREMEGMRPGAFLINTGRGALIDTAALVAALERGRLGGAALDVLEGEESIFYADCAGKAIQNPFLPRLQALPNVILSPHTAYYTGRVLYDTVEQTILQCLDFERGQHYA